VNGLDLCKAIRNHPDWSALPIIFLTAYSEANLIQQVFAIGADDFVNKPVVGPEIISRISNLMERQQVQRLKAAERHRLDDNQAKSTVQDQIQVALVAIDRSLHSLQDQAVIQDRASLQMLQEACEQVDRLQKLLLKDN
jgi:DNA-binding response OmpR family regulator